MGYDVHITKKAYWFDEGPDISPSDWSDYVATDSELRITGGIEADPLHGSAFRYVSPLLAEWNGHPSGNIVWFDFREGSVSTVNPDEETMEKLQQIAAKLGARVQGEEGEFYDPIVEAPTLSPSDVFQTIIQTAAAAQTDVDFMSALVIRGMSATEAFRTVRLIQVSWARTLLHKVPITFSGDFIFFDAAGAIQERGQLETEEWFRAASLAAAEYQSHPDFRRVAEGSTEFQSVQAELKAARESQPLIGLPVFLFALRMSEDGMKRALATIEVETQALEQRLSPPPNKKKSGPWWRFW